MTDLLAEIDESIEWYACLLEPWEPDILGDPETGSRVLRARDAVEEMLARADGGANLDAQRAEVGRLDAFMREHSAEIWGWCAEDGRDREREEEKIPTSRWWWYLDKPETWPPLPSTAS